MSWHFSQALVAEFSRANCSGGEPSAPSKSTTTAEASSSAGKTKDTSNRFPYGMTSEHLTDVPGMESWMSSLRDSRASRLALQAKCEEKTTTATCGRTPLEFWAKWDRSGCCWKTYRGLFAQIISARSSETWQHSGLMLGGMLSQRRSVARPIYANGYGLLPTPQAFDSKGSCWSEEWKRKNETRAKGKRSSLVDYVEQFPTPTVKGNYNKAGLSAKSGDGLATFVAKYPIPTSRDWRSGKASQATHERNARPLNEVVGGSLNPEFVEWLMEFPIGFSDLEPLEMHRWQAWLSAHGMS